MKNLKKFQISIENQKKIKGQGTTEMGACPEYIGHKLTYYYIQCHLRCNNGYQPLCISTDTDPSRCSPIRVPGPKPPAIPCW